MTARRDPDREHRFLADAARGHHGVVEHATERLDAGEQEYGSRWARVGIPSLIAELLEEASDLGAWAALCDQALDHDTQLTDYQREHVRAMLVVARRLMRRSRTRCGRWMTGVRGERDR